MDILAKITKLSKFVTSSVVRRSCKMDAVPPSLEGLEGTQYKVVVFSQYVKTLLQIKVQLTNVPVSIFHGGMSADERNQVVRDFESSDGPKALLISLKAGGVGLNLSTASLIILFDRWWNPAVEDSNAKRTSVRRTSSLQVIGS